jgi:hypothetical protein
MPKDRTAGLLAMARTNMKTLQAEDALATFRRSMESYARTNFRSLEVVRDAAAEGTDLRFDLDDQKDLKRLRRACKAMHALGLKSDNPRSWQRYLAGLKAMRLKP